MVKNLYYDISEWKLGHLWHLNPMNNKMIHQSDLASSIKMRLMIEEAHVLLYIYIYLFAIVR